MIGQHLLTSKIKNIIFILLALSLILLSFSVPYPAIAASEIDTSKAVELKWCIPNGPQEDTKLVQTEINKYIKNKINATVIFYEIPFLGYENKIHVMFAAGEENDICFTSNWMLKYSECASYNYFTDITDMLDTYAPNTKAFLGKNILKGAQVNGRLYAIPTYTNNIVSSNGILLNKKLVQKYKVDTSKIKKLEDLEAIFKKIKSSNSKIINFYPFNTFGSISVYNTLNFEKIIGDRFPGAVAKDGKSSKVINDFESTSAKSLFLLMNKWYKSGYITKSAAANISFYKNNKSNIFALYSGISPSTSESIKRDENIDYIPVELTKPSLVTSAITSSMNAILYESKNPERALMLLELANTDEKLSNLLNYGIEGVHYKKTGIKSISQISPRYLKYNSDYMVDFGNESIKYSLPGYDANLWQKVKENVNSAVPSPLLGFNFNSEPVAAQLTKLQGIVNKYYVDLSLGKIDPAVNLTKMNTELKNAGLQKVLTEMQKQVDAFVKAQN